MPNFKDFLEPPKRISIRERALQDALNRRAEYVDRLAALQDYQSTGLSPLDIEASAERESYYQTALAQSDDLIKQIRWQNAQIEDDRVRRSLKPSAEKSDVLYRRSEFDRNAAILGILERERRRNAPLSREAYARAKATAASRSRFDIYRAYHAQGLPFSKMTPEALSGVDVPASAGVDPCEYYCLKQKHRREVMFAKKLAGRGYRTSHRPSDCVCP